MKSNYSLAADMFTNGAGECNALAEYVDTLANDGDALPENIKAGIIEKSSDELNHVFGNILDAIELSGFKIAMDGKDELIKRFTAAFEDKE